jgi:hypothetical protein
MGKLLMQTRTHLDNRQMRRSPTSLRLLLLAVAVIGVGALGGCGGGSSSTAGNTSKPTKKVGATDHHQEVERCVGLWNTGHFDQYDMRKFLGQNVALQHGGPAVVTTDPSGICLVAFPESMGSEPGNGGGAAYTFSFERNAWDLYALIDHEAAPIDPAAVEKQRAAFNARVTLMQELEGQVEREPNALLDDEGHLALAVASHGSEGEEAKPSGEVIACHQVVLEGSGEEFPVYLSAIGVSCEDAIEVVDQTLFGQGASPPEGFECTGLSSEAGRCVKGGEEIVYSKLGGKTSMPLRATESASSELEEEGGPGQAAEEETSACVESWNERSPTILKDFEASVLASEDPSAFVTRYVGPQIEVPGPAGSSAIVVPGECIVGFLGPKSYAANIDGKWYPAGGEEGGLFSFGQNNLAAKPAAMVEGGKIELTGESLRSPGA